jgi:hypothetical protein
MPRKPLASPQERIKMPRAVAITGETERTLQAAAARGDIEGAAKPFKCWTFNEAKLRAWLKAKESKPCRRNLEEEEDRGASRATSSTAAASNGRGFRSPAKSSEEAYQRAMQALRSAEPANGTSAR